MKSFFPKICPACGEPLVIERGDKSDTLKLMCNNKNCFGSILKRLQKGIVALEIRGLGPKVIEKLLNAGITSSVDLFDPEKFNEKNLIESGEFRKGRSLEKIMTSVNSTKSIPIHKLILSLQIDDVGKTVSDKIGQLISGVTPDFTGLPYVVRDNIDSLTSKIKEVIENVENAGIEVVRFQPPKKVVATKTIKKCVAVDLYAEHKTPQSILDVVEKLDWEIVAGCDVKCDFLVVEDKNADTWEIRWAKENGLKIMSLKQIKLLFL